VEDALALPLLTLLGVRLNKLAFKFLNVVLLGITVVNVLLLKKDSYTATKLKPALISQPYVQPAMTLVVDAIAL